MQTPNTPPTPATASPTPELPADWDVRQRYIRIVEEHDNGMVELEFAVGEPELFVEMLLPRDQFEDFCAMQGVTPTHGRLPEAAEGSDAHEWDWSLRQARDQHFRNESDPGPSA